MDRKDIINFLNSESTFNQVLGAINHECQLNDVRVDEYPIHYFIAGGSVSNTIHYLLNKDKFKSPVINDIDLFFFNHVNNYNYFWEVEDVANNFIHGYVNNDHLNLDGYGRAWLGSNGENIKMVNSERFGVINKISIDVSKFNGDFNETDYYKQLLFNFDLNCCLAGLDRINNKIIYTEKFVDFLVTNKIEVTNVSQPLQTTIRLHKKSAELKTDTSNLEIEMGLIQHSFALIEKNSIGPEWQQKTKINRELVLKYFTFNVEQKNNQNNVFSYGAKDFVLNQNYEFFQITKKNNLITFWDFFVRKKNQEVYDNLVNFYTLEYGINVFNNKNRLYSERKLPKIINQGDTTFIEILDLVPNYFDCQYTLNDIKKVSDFNKYLKFEAFVDPMLFLVNNIKDHIRLIRFCKNNFFDKTGDFKKNLFLKVIHRIYVKKLVNTNNVESYFIYENKIKEFKNVLNNLWIKNYHNKYGIKHKFITNIFEW